MTEKQHARNDLETSKSEIVRAHEKLQELPEKVGENLDGIYGEIYEAVNKGEFP